MRRRRLLLVLAAVVAGGLPGSGPVAAAPAGASPATWVPARLPCFGAAARDPLEPCAAQPLRFAAIPAPADAPLVPNSPCTVLTFRGERTFCASGTSRARAVSTVALVGDSHAPSWRAAVEVAARAQRWRLLTLSRSSCPLTFARRQQDGPGAQACFAWVEAALRRLRAHPEIRTVIVATSADYDWLPGPDGDAHAAGVAGYAAMFRSLAPSVRRIVVLRDNPRASFETLPCVAAALARGRRPDLRCALARDQALIPDAAADAAQALAPGGRTGVVDLTSSFCDAERCLPVVGGALVYKDASHLSPPFAATLGPYLLAALREQEAEPGAGATASGS